MGVLCVDERAETQKPSILGLLLPSAKAEAMTYAASASTQSITQALMGGYQPYAESLVWADANLPFGDTIALGGLLVVGAVGIIADAGRVFVESLPLPEDTGMTTEAFPLPSRGEIPSIESIPTVREVPINEGIDVVPEPRPLVPPDMPQSTPGPTIQQSEPLDYPGDDPAKSPGDDWEWRGKGKPEEGKGNWYNPKTGEQLHPDLNHPKPIGPHWDYRNPVTGDYRIFPDGSMTSK